MDWGFELMLVSRVGLAALLGAALFALVSLHAGSEAPTRLAAAVPTGIGFLGAGMILRGEKGISGLTTAASVWGIAAIGLAIGYGMLVIAVFSAVLILGVFLLRHWTKPFMHAGHSHGEAE